MGRHAQFERQEVLNRAVKTFWDLGFHAARMTDLIQSTQLKPGSLYACFSSKEELFLECLENYGRQLVSDFEVTLTQQSPKSALIQYFQHLATELQGANPPHGCLLVNSLIELSRIDREVMHIVEKYIHQVEGLLEKTLHEAIALGEISPTIEPKELATTFMVSMWGIRILSETTHGRAKISGVINQLLRLLG